MKQSTKFQSPDDYMDDYIAYKRGCTKAILCLKHGIVVKKYPRTACIARMSIDSHKTFGTYVGEIDLVHKFKNKLF